MDLEQGFQLDDLSGMLRRRAPLIAVCGMGLLLLAILASSLIQNEYESYATLLVEPQTISSELIEANVEGRDINNRLHLIQMQILSRGRLSRIIDDLDVYPDLSREKTREEVIEHMRDHIALLPVLPELETEALAQAGIKAKELQINTFRLAFRHWSATKAAAVTNRLANDFIEEHIKERVQISGDTSDFIETELGRLASLIAEVDNRIAEVKSANTGSLPEDLAANQRLHERSLDALREAQRSLAVAESDEAFYRQQFLSGGSTDPYTFRNVMSPERRLEALEVGLAEYKSRGFTAKHPDIVATLQEMEELRVSIASGAESGEGKNLSIAQQNAKAEEQRAHLRVVSAREDIQRLNDEIARVDARLGSTPRVAEQLGSLEREYEHLSDSYQEYSSKRLDASVAAQMESRQKGEQFRILESAFPGIEPISPNRPLIIILGLVLGVALGSALALALELGDDSYRNSRALQDSLRIPVLAQIPEVVLESDRLALRRRWVRQGVAAALVTAVVLVASFVGYRLVNQPPETPAAAEETAASDSALGRG